MPPLQSQMLLMIQLNKTPAAVFFFNSTSDATHSLISKRKWQLPPAETTGPQSNVTIFSMWSCKYFCLKFKKLAGAAAVIATNKQFFALLQLVAVAYEFTCYDYPSLIQFFLCCWAARHGALCLYNTLPLIWTHGLVYPPCLITFCAAMLQCCHSHSYTQNQLPLCCIPQCDCYEEIPPPVSVHGVQHSSLRLQQSSWPKQYSLQSDLCATTQPSSSNHLQQHNPLLLCLHPLAGWLAATQQHEDGYFWLQDLAPLVCIHLRSLCEAI
mmetsp:Transcript_28228/g.48969  ORF Transcript_28228/g.48969 Transcript_28228/m.48969 type:complete len:268 (-) Transcript_28228:370-1173(-)